MITNEINCPICNAKLFASFKQESIGIDRCEFKCFGHELDKFILYYQLTIYATKVYEKLDVNTNSNVVIASILNSFWRANKSKDIFVHSIYDYKNNPILFDSYIDLKDWKSYMVLI